MWLSIVSHGANVKPCRRDFDRTRNCQRWRHRICSARSPWRHGSRERVGCGRKSSGQQGEEGHGSGKSCARHGRRQRHRPLGSAGAAGRRLERGGHRPAQGRARQDRRDGQGRRRQDGGGHGRRRQARRCEAPVRRDQEGVRRPARFPVQQRRLRCAAGADGGPAVRDVEVGGGRDPARLVPVRAGSHQDHEGRKTRRAGASSTTARSRRTRRGRTRSPTPRPSMPSPASPSASRSTAASTTSPAGSSTSATPIPPWAGA